MVSFMTHVLCPKQKSPCYPVNCVIFMWHVPAIILLLFMLKWSFFIGGVQLLNSFSLILSVQHLYSHCVQQNPGVPQATFRGSANTFP
jgi:hypothetical protein